ncbi:MAG: aldehyde dehydrogenase family protein [Verrucomicrobiota bacterium]
MIKDFLINGAYTHATDKTYDVIQPSDGSVLMTLPSANETDVNNAVAAAKAALEEWRFMDELERQRLMFRWADLLEERAEEIAAQVGDDAGMGKTGQLGTVGKIAAMARYYAGFIVNNYGDVFSLGDEYMNFTVKDPVGVVGLMPPWNSPLESTMQKMGPALAAGNTVVLRPPEEGPSGGLLVAQTAHDAGFPKGAINAICGQGPESAKALVSHPDVRLISFTGSATTGKAIAQSCAAQMKRYVMELGGKSPVLVFEDADLDKAAEEAATFAFCYQGQVCCANTRILVQESVRETFTEKLLAQVESLDMGVDDSGKPLGPIFNRKVFDTVTKYVEIGKQDGKLLAGGTPEDTENGFYYPATVFSFEDSSSAVCQDEIFGPVLALIPFKDEAEAIRIANETHYGLAATVYSGDRQRIFRVIRRLESGTVWANCCFQFNIHMPWGGPKDSGQGREFGKYAIEPYYEIKNVWLG